MRGNYEGIKGKGKELVRAEGNKRTKKRKRRQRRNNMRIKKK